jgi:opacity protein-like surface antigen
MTRNLWRAVVAALCLVGLPATAHADITAFLGVSPTSAVRLGRGVSAGAGLVVVGFEVELAQLVERVDDGAAALATGMANVIVQTPLDVSRMQFYGTTGVGVYRETLGPLQETSVGGNVGGGVKIRLTGPLKLRLDYRLFRLRGAPVTTTYHRVYAGATLGF